MSPESGAQQNSNQKMAAGFDIGGKMVPCCCQCSGNSELSDLSNYKCLMIKNYLHFCQMKICDPSQGKPSEQETTNRMEEIRRIDWCFRPL